MDDYLLRFPGWADFSVAHTGTTILIDRHPETEWSTLRHLLIDQVLPQALSARGALVLHGAAIRAGGRAVGILGTAGSGKSTLAASFHESGYPVLCDDCLFIRATADNAPSVVPSYPGIRLWPDTVSHLALSESEIGPVAQYTEKMRVRAEDAQAFDGEPVRLARLYVLAPADASRASHDARIEALAGGAALIELVKHAHRLDVTDRRLLAGEFERLTWLSERCPTRRLAYPRDFARLADVRAAILADVGLG
jgi:hypothetical protein